MKKRVLTCFSVVWLLMGIYLASCAPITRAASPPEDSLHPQTVDVIVALDNSGSMKKNDPSFLTQTVVTGFLAGLGENSRLGMVIFDADARLVEPLSERTGQLARATFLKSLEKVTYTGLLSDTPAAVERAIYELKINGRPDAEKAIVLLTDGIVDTGDKNRDHEKEIWLKGPLADESKRSGIRIFGIAFTDQADFSLIQTIAIRTDGEYFRAFSAGEIQGIFTMIEKRLMPAPVPDEQTLAAKPIDTADRALEPAESKTDPKRESAVLPPPATPLKAAPSSDEGQTELPAQKFAAFKRLLVSPAGIFSGLFVLFLVFLALFIINRRLRSRSEHTPSIDGETDAKPMPRADLVDVKDITRRKTIQLTNRKTRIGRDTVNDIAIPQDTVSSFHALIVYRDGFFFLEDQRSKNKTRLNGVDIPPYTPKKLKNGDRIMFNVFEFIFLLPDQIPTGETVMDFREQPDTVVMSDTWDGERDADSREKPAIPQAILIDMKNITGKKTFAITKRKTRIGRGVHNEVVISKMAISGSHACIEFKDGVYYLEDQRSTNKTRINGEEIEPYIAKKLKSGDEIMFDVHKFIFLLERQLPTGDTGRRWSEE